MIGSFNEFGVWYAIRPEIRRGDGRGILLDRDGVLVEERNYLHQVADVALIPSILHLVKEAHRQYIPVAVVTNQSGIDRGMFGWEDFFAVEAEIDRQLATYGEASDLKVACPFHPNFTSGYNEAMNGWRKPGPKMAEFACQMLGLDPRRTWMIGDKASDIQSAKTAGLRGAHFLRGVYRSEEAAAVALADEKFWVRAVNADDAIDIIADLGNPVDSVGL